MTNEVIVFPDAALLVIDYLRDELDTRGYPDIHVGAKVPNPRPSKFVRVARVGGIAPFLVADDATLVVEAWETDAADAMTLAQLCRGLVRALAGTAVDGVPVYRVAELAGPANLPDPASDQARATFTITVRLRGVAA